MTTTLSDAALRELFRREAFPRASSYDPAWIMDNMMGPHALWLAEWLCQAVRPTGGTRVLDLGCGTALSSIFLAKEFGATVFAADLWIGPDENRVRIDAAGEGARVFPLRAEAHDLPLAERSFDFVLSVDAFHYFGTSDLYLGYCRRFLRPGGRIGIVVPSVRREIEDEIPEHLAPFWAWDFCSFHSPDWWLRHWRKTGLVTDVTADWLDDGAELWLAFAELCAAHGPERIRAMAAQEAEMLRADAGRTLGFTRLVATRPEDETGSAAASSG